jgi:hypothetical protein
VSPILEDQIRAFAARNIGGETPPRWTENLPAYAVLAPDRGRRGLVVLAAVLVLLLVITGVAIARIGGEGASTIVIEPAEPAAPPDPLLVLATRAAAVDTKFFMGWWPEHARAIETTVGAVGPYVVGGSCDPATPILVVEFRWDEPVTRRVPEGWPVPPGAEDPVPTDIVQFFRIGPIDGSELATTCDSAGTGLLPEHLELAALATPGVVALGDHVLEVASALAIRKASLLENLPASAEAIVTTPDRLAEVGLPWSPRQPDCNPAEVLVVQLHYPAPPESYLGEGPTGPVHAAIGSDVTTLALPFETPLWADCGGGGRMTPTPVDLSIVGTPTPIDLTQ